MQVTPAGSSRPGHYLDEGSFHACVPFRVALAAHRISDDYEPGYAGRRPACRPGGPSGAQQSGIPGNLAKPSVAIARTAADALDKQDAVELADPGDTTSFRQWECP
jgi:hypothetical protein